MPTTQQQQQAPPAPTIKVELPTASLFNPNELAFSEDGKIVGVQESLREQQLRLEELRRKVVSEEQRLGVKVCEFCAGGGGSCADCG